MKRSKIDKLIFQLHIGFVDPDSIFPVKCIIRKVGSIKLELINKRWAVWRKMIENNLIHGFVVFQSHFYAFVKLKNNSVLGFTVIKKFSLREIGDVFFIESEDFNSLNIRHDIIEVEAKKCIKNLPLIFIG